MMKKCEICLKEFQPETSVEGAIDICSICYQEWESEDTIPSSPSSELTDNSDIEKCWYCESPNVHLVALDENPDGNVRVECFDCSTIGLADKTDRAIEKWNIFMNSLMINMLLEE